MPDVSHPIIYALVAYLSPTGWRNFPGSFSALPVPGDLIEATDQDTGGPIKLRVKERVFRNVDKGPDLTNVSVLCIPIDD